LVEGALAVSGQYCESAISLHPLQQVADFDVGIAVVAVLDLAPLAKQSVCLVEQQDGGTFFRCIENAAQVFLGFTDILAHHLAEVDHVKIEPQLIGEYFARHSLARAAGAGEQGSDPEAASSFGGKAPLLVDFRALAKTHRDLLEKAFLFFGENEVVPSGYGLDPLRQTVQAGPRLQPARVP